MAKWSKEQIEAAAKENRKGLDVQDALYADFQELQIRMVAVHELGQSVIDHDNECRNGDNCKTRKLMMDNLTEAADHLRIAADDFAADVAVLQALFARRKEVLGET